VPGKEGQRASILLEKRNTIRPAEQKSESRFTRTYEVLAKSPIGSRVSSIDDSLDRDLFREKLLLNSKLDRYRNL